MTSDRRRQEYSKAAVVRLNGAVKTNATQRIKSYEFAKKMLTTIQDARKDLRENHAIFNPTEARIAKWLNDNDIRTINHAGWGESTVINLFNMATDNYAYQAVLECRTQMTALALSADFETADAGVDRLENEYIEIIAEAVTLGCQLRDEPKLEREQARKLAREAAIKHARTQRRDKPAMSMEARDGLWLDMKPTHRIRKIFEDRSS